MALRELNAVCNNCGTRFCARPTRSFVGFQKLGCPQCVQKLLYPLTSGYRAIYRVIVVFVGVSFAGYVFGKGDVLWPGVTGIAALIGAIIGLVKDVQIRKKITNAESQGGDAVSG